MSGSVSWRGVPSAYLRWEEWDEEFVVFNELSGHTHILNSMAAESLKSLQMHSMDALALSRHLATIFDIEPNDELVGQVEAMLWQFDELGLIEPSVA